MRPPPPPAQEPYTVEQIRIDMLVKLTMMPGWWFAPLCRPSEGGRERAMQTIVAALTQG